MLPLTDDDTLNISGPITIEEIEAAVHQLPVCKTPGPDGLSGEFYEAFKPLLCTIFFSVFDCCLQLNSLPPSLRKFHTLKTMKIAILYSYRQITLTNVDDQVFATIFSGRLQCATCGLGS